MIIVRVNIDGQNYGRDIPVNGPIVDNKLEAGRIEVILILIDTVIHKQLTSFDLHGVLLSPLFCFSYPAKPQASLITNCRFYTKTTIVENSCPLLHRKKCNKCSTYVQNNICSICTT